ncbi:MAG: ATP synthase F0 subunit B [Deltaproteobacteria bacterium]|nr:ATP synthase F0 subunit B [Deltaproteobacteria bacterium]
MARINSQKRQTPHAFQSGMFQWRRVSVPVSVLAAQALLWATPALASEGAGDPWKDLMFKGINFAVLALLLFWVLRKPIPAFLRGNAQAVKEELAQTREAHAKAQQELAEQKLLIEGLEAELKKMAQLARVDAEKEKAHMVEEARKQAERIKSQMRLQMEQEVANAVTALRKEITEEMVRLVEQTLPKRVDGATSTKLFQEFITHLEARR